MTADIKSYRWVLLVGIWAIYFCFGIVTISMAPLIPNIAAELDIPNSTMGAILGAWPLVYIASAIPCGILLDKLNPREALFLGAVFIAASALMRGLAPDQLTLFLAVGLFGLGGPFVSVGAPKFVSRWFTGQHRGFAIGVCTSGPVFGGATALALTQPWLMPIVDNEWRQVMFVCAGVTIAIGVIWYVIASHPLARGTTQTATDRTPFSTRTLMDIIANPAVIAILAMGAGVFFINHGIINWLPEILRSKGMTSAEAGLWASAATMVGIIGLLVVPRLATPQRRTMIMVILFSSLLIASVLLLLPSTTFLPVALLMLGTARAAVTGMVLLLLMEAPGVDAKNHGLLGGIFFVVGEIGGVLGPLTLGLLSSEDGTFNYSLMALTGVCALMVTLTVGLARSAKRAKSLQKVNHLSGQV